MLHVNDAEGMQQEKCERRELIHFFNMIFSSFDNQIRDSTTYSRKQLRVRDFESPVPKSDNSLLSLSPSLT
jgi:hypothetical protein